MSTQDGSTDQDRPNVLGGLRILIVEDELLVALETVAVVERCGGIVAGPFPRVAAALRYIQSNAVDGALLDVNLAGQFSYDIADVLAERDVPFIFSTGNGGNVMPVRFRERPVLYKPTTPERLIAAMVGAFARPRMERLAALTLVKPG